MAEHNGHEDRNLVARAEYGESQVFEFKPDVGNHVSSILVDGVYLSSLIQSYVFENVTANHMIEVSFSADGTATVPSGSGVTVFLASGATLTFGYTDGGTATGEEKLYPTGGVTAWEISVSLVFDGEAIVVLLYDDTGLGSEEANLRLVRADSYYALRSDVNNDLVVGGTDVSIIANAVKQPQWYDPFLDINNDGVVDEADIHIANENIGMTLEDITDGIDTDLNIIWGTTDHFSIFGVHCG